MIETDVHTIFRPKRETKSVYLRMHINVDHNHSKSFIYVIPVLTRMCIKTLYHVAERILVKNKRCVTQDTLMAVYGYLSIKLLGYVPLEFCDKVLYKLLLILEHSILINIKYFNRVIENK